MFGPLTVVTDERSLGPADFGGVKPKEIFEILLLARGRPVTKQALADSLWPQKQPNNVSATLETYVSILRRKLFTDRSTARRVLVTGNGSYRLYPDHMSVDIDEFDQLLARADRLGTDRLDLLRKASDLAVGDLLEDAPSARWAEVDREVYGDRVTRVRLLIASEYLMAGDYIRAIRHAESALEIRPYSEEVVRVLMLANHGLGQTELARQAYERCCTLLGDELGLDCSTETADLAGAIGAGATITELLQAHACPVSSSARSNSGSKERRDPKRLMPFIGRGAELGRVRRVVERAGQREFSLVFVHGRRGVGRTSFVEELSTSLPGAVGKARYSPLEDETPKLPLAEVICDALKGLPEGVEADRYASSAILNGGERAFSMLARLLHIDAPIVLLLDDFQWADCDTIEMIGRLMRELPGLPVTIVGMVRDSGDAKQRLDGLTPTDTIRLWGLRADDWEGSEAVDRSLLACAGGSPSLMADCYRWHQAGHSGPSPSLSESILSMARGLGGVYPELLQAASIQPAPFELSDLVLVNGAARSISIDHLHKLCEVEILEIVEERFRFRSPIVSQVIANTVA